MQTVLYRRPIHLDTVCPNLCSKGAEMLCHGVAIEMSNHSRKYSFNWLTSLIVICSQDVTQLHKQVSRRDHITDRQASAREDGKLYVLVGSLGRYLLTPYQLQ
jgi:hypothetical protein